MDFKSKILELLAKRSSESSICPSEVLPPHDKKNKEMMEHVRSSARILAHEGVIEITQKGAVVDPENFKGAIRLRWKKKAKS